jgi:DNA-binding beta-propeller fold protein YncE
MIRKIVGFAALLLAALPSACAADASPGSATNGASQPGSQGAGASAGTGSIDVGATGNAPGSGGTGGAPIVVPPEKEVEAAFLAPVVTGKYVFSANPQSGRVAVIDAESYAVRLFNAGFGPTYLTAIPGNRGAIVINALSHDTTLFELEGDTVTIADVTLPVHEGANAWATSPDGRFAIAWTRAADEHELDPTAGSQTISVLDLEQMTVKRLSVGFHPSQVVVDAASRRAFVVSDDGVSVIELSSNPQVSLLVPVSEDPLELPAARDVSILPDGSYAVVRIEGSSVLRVADLAREDGLVAYDLGAPITDVDLSRDGKLAVAAVPGLGKVVLAPLPPTDAASFEQVTISGEIASSVALSDDSQLALLYQNGADNSHLTLLDLRPDHERALRTVDLKGPVSAAFAAPGAQSAIVFQKPLAGSRKVGLFSGVPTFERRSPKIVGTDAAPSALAFAAAGDFALVTVGGPSGNVYGVYRVRLDTLQEDFVQLASPPVLGATGIVDRAGRGFVAQTHPEGRITFIDLTTAQAHTITGFELAARILQ